MEPSIEKAKARAEKAASGAAGRVSVRAKSAVNIVAHESHALADALRVAAAQAERDGARVVQEPLRKMADFCDELAGRASEHNPRQLLNGLTDLGRREPLMLFGAATAAAVLGRRAMRAAGQDGHGASAHDGQPSKAKFTPPEASMPPLESPPSDRDVAIEASTAGGMSQAQAKTSAQRDQPRRD